MLQASIWLFMVRFETQLKGLKHRLAYSCHRENVDEEEDLFEKTVAEASAVEKLLVQLMSTLALIFAFGSWVPLLLIIAPACVWIQRCALVWCQNTSSRRDFGRDLATNILVESALVTCNLDLALVWCCRSNLESHNFIGSAAWGSGRVQHSHW